MRRIITNEIFAEIERDYNSGLDLDKISEKYGFKKESIQRKFKQNGKVLLSTAKKFSEDELRNVISDYYSGMKPFELAKKYNRTSATIIGKLRSLDIYERTNFRFSTEDIEFLRIYYPRNDWDEITLRFPHVPKHSIHSKMSKLGIRADLWFDENIWTQEELNILFKHYEKDGVDLVCKLLKKRSYKSITTKAKRLGLKTRSFWSSEDDQLFKDKYHNLATDDFIKLFPNRTRSAIIAHANDLGLVCKWKFTKQESSYISENWKYMSDSKMAEVLGRSPRSITNKRIQLRYLRDKENSSYNDLSDFIRRNNLDWKKESIKSCGYKCVITGKRFDDIHHIYGLNLILNETLEMTGIELKSSMNDYLDEELKNILTTFRFIQSKYPLGICLSKNVHMMFHNKYGYGNNTQRQWDEFVKEFNLEEHIM